jgi:hypothetical protein
MQLRQDLNYNIVYVHLLSGQQLIDETIRQNSL